MFVPLTTASSIAEVSAFNDESADVHAEHRAVRLATVGQLRTRHMDAMLPYNYPNGDLLAAVNCRLDTQTHRITRADLAGGPPIDDKAVKYVRSQGLCPEDANPK